MSCPATLTFHVSLKTAQPLTFSEGNVYSNLNCLQLYVLHLDGQRWTDGLTVDVVLVQLYGTEWPRMC